MSKKPRIQVIEDEVDIAELLRFNLSKAGYDVAVAHSGELGFKNICAEVPDLVLLDLMLPDLTGLEVCRRIRSRAQFSNVAVIIVTAKGEEEDVIRGLEQGADDYIVKPFSPRVVLARVQANLRKRKEDPKAQKDQVLQVGNLTLHPGRHEVHVGGKRLDLTKTEFKILQLLASRPGWVFTRTQIVETIQATDYAVTPRAVDVQIVGLRKKFGEFAEYVETVRGIGYRFRE